MEFYTIESHSNFLFIGHPALSAQELFNHLKKYGILVRYFNMSRIDNFLRVSIGTDVEMNEFLRIMKKIIIEMKISFLKTNWSARPSFQRLYNSP